MGLEVMVTWGSWGLGLTFQGSHFNATAYDTVATGLKEWEQLAFLSSGKGKGDPIHWKGKYLKKETPFTFSLSITPAS